MTIPGAKRQIRKLIAQYLRLSTAVDARWRAGKRSSAMEPVMSLQRSLFAAHETIYGTDSSDCGSSSDSSGRREKAFLLGVHRIYRARVIEWLAITYPAVLYFVLAVPQVWWALYSTTQPIIVLHRPRQIRSSSRLPLRAITPGYSIWLALSYFVHLAFGAQVFDCSRAPTNTRW